jgi:hypothetical protein
LLLHDGHVRSTGNELMYFSVCIFHTNSILVYRRMRDNEAKSIDVSICFFVLM